MPKSLLEQLVEQAGARAAEPDTRPCAPILPQGTEAAASACWHGGMRDRCAWGARGPLGVLFAGCPQAQLAERYSERALRLQRAGVPRREADLILADSRTVGRVPLLPTDALLHVSAALVGTAAPVIPLVLGGARGVGKTVAACWAIAQLGGRYITAYQLNPDLDVGPLKLAPLLVIDQVGREPRGPSDYARLKLEELVDYRFSQRLSILLVANLNEVDFGKDYRGAITDRLKAGRFVFLAGESLRGVQAP